MNKDSFSGKGTAAIGDGPPFVGRKILAAYAQMLRARACEGFSGDWYIEVTNREFLQIMYETAQYSGVASTGGTLVWAPWPTDKDQSMPCSVRVHLPGGSIVFRPLLPEPQAAPPQEA